MRVVVDAGQGYGSPCLSSTSDCQEVAVPDSEQKDSYGSLGGEPTTLKELVDALAKELEKIVRERPLVSVAVALAAGYLLASLRRR